MNLEFLTTSGCTLCEEAFDLVLTCGALQGVRLTQVDIAHDDSLLACYAERIPVLRVIDVSGDVLHELDWPFDEQAISRILTA